MAAEHQLEEGLLLVRIGLEPEIADPAEEAIEDFVGVARSTRRHPREQGRPSSDGELRHAASLSIAHR